MNPFFNKTQEWLETQLEIVQEELLSGAQITSVSSGDSSVSQKINYNTMEKYRMLYMALYSIDPTNYPLTNLPAKITRPQYIA